MPHEDQDKEDPSRLINCYGFFKTLTQKSAGYEIAGLELKFWLSRMDTWKVLRLKEDGTAVRIYCCTADLVALFSTELFVCFGSGEQSEVVQLVK